MKKRSKSDRSIEALQKSADKQGIRLQKADAGCTTDADCVEKRLKKGPYKDREPVM